MHTHSLSSTPLASRPSTSGGGSTLLAERGRSSRHSSTSNRRKAAAASPPPPPPTSAPTVLYPATPGLAILALEDAEDAEASRPTPIPPAGGLQQAIGADQFEIQGEAAFIPAVAGSARKARGAQQQEDASGGRRHYKALLPDPRKTPQQQQQRPPSATAAAAAAVPVSPVVIVDAYGAEMKRYGTPLDRQRAVLARALARFHRAEEREAKTRAQHQRTIVPPPVAPQPLLCEPAVAARPHISASFASAGQSRPSSSFSSRPGTAASHSHVRAPFSSAHHFTAAAAEPTDHSVPFWLPLTKREGSALFDEVLDAGPPALSTGKQAVGGLHASAERQAVSLRIHHAVERQALQTQIAEDALISAHDRAREQETARRAWEASQRDINPYSYDPAAFAQHTQQLGPNQHNAAHPSAYIPYLPREMAQQELAATQRRPPSQKQAALPEIAYFYAADGSLQQAIVPPVSVPPVPVFLDSRDRSSAVVNPSALRDPALPNLLGWVMSLHPERVALRAAADRWRGNVARNDAAAAGQRKNDNGAAQYPARLQQQQQQQQQQPEEEKQQHQAASSHSHSHSHSMPRSIDSSPIPSQSVSTRHSSAASPLYVTPRPPAHTRAESEAAAARELQDQRDIMNAANHTTGAPPRHPTAAGATATTNAAAGTQPVSSASASFSSDDDSATPPAVSVAKVASMLSPRATPPPVLPGSYPAHIPSWKASILAGEAQQVERLRAQSEWRRQQGLEESDADQIEIMRHMALANQPALVARLTAPVSPSKAGPARPSPTQDLLAFASRHRTTASGSFRLPLTSTPDPNSLLPIIPGPEVVIDSQSFPPPFALSALTDADLVRAPRPNFAALGESKAEASRNRLRELQHEALFDVNEVATLVVEERRSRRGSTHQLSGGGSSSGNGDDAATVAPARNASTSRGTGASSGRTGNGGLPPSHRSKSRSAHITSENASTLLQHHHRGAVGAGTHRPKSARVHQPLGLKKRRSSLGSHLFDADASGSLDLSFLPSAAQLAHESALRERLFEYFRNPSECSFVSSDLSHNLEPHTPWLLELLADCRCYALHQTEVMELLRTINAASMRPSDVIDSGVGVVQAFRAQLDALGREPKFPRPPSDIPPLAAKAGGGDSAAGGVQQLSGSPWHTSALAQDSPETSHPKLEEDTVVQCQASELAFSLRAGPTLPPGVAAAARRPASPQHTEAASASPSTSPPVATFARSLSTSNVDETGRVAHFDSEHDAAEHPLLAVAQPMQSTPDADAAPAAQSPVAAEATAPAPVAAAAVPGSSLSSSGDADRSAIVDWLQSDSCSLFLDSPSDLSVSLGEIDRLLEAGGGVEGTLRLLRDMADAGLRFMEFTEILPEMHKQQQQRQQSQKRLSTKLAAAGTQAPAAFTVSALSSELDL